jgi:SAM-dependent methyltransferase
MVGPYTSQFYQGQKVGSRTSADQIAPLLIELLHPRSVIDVGCGVGHWLSTFKRLGVPLVRGIDGPWVGDQLHIDAEEFTSYDFSSASLPFEVILPQEKYDLAISLEFLEHLSPSLARDLVRFLCSVSDVVVAGAAVPGQGGTYHINEQWPDYWAALFREQGYVPCDVIRFAIWNTANLQPWYAQNIILYFRNRIPNNVLHYAQRVLSEIITEPRSIVHPAIFRLRTELSFYPVNKLLAACAHKVVRGLGRHFGKSRS